MIAVLVVAAFAVPPLFEAVRQLPSAVRILGQMSLLAAVGAVALFLDQRRKRIRGSDDE